MKGPFPDVNLLCLGGRVRGAFPVSRSQRSGSDLGWASPAHLPLCQSSCQRYVVSASPRQDQWQIPQVGCSDSLEVASRSGTLIGHNTDRRGIAAWEENAVGSKGGTCARGRTPQQVDHWEHTGGGGHTRSATACSFLRRSRVLNRAAPGHLCMGIGLCDISPLPRDARAIFAVCSWFTLHRGV